MKYDATIRNRYKVVKFVVRKECALAHSRAERFYVIGRSFL